MSDSDTPQVTTHTLDETGRCQACLAISYGRNLSICGSHSQLEAAIREGRIVIASEPGITEKKGLTRPPLL